MAAGQEEAGEKPDRQSEVGSPCLQGPRERPRTPASAGPHSKQACAPADPRDRGGQERQTDSRLSCPRWSQWPDEQGKGETGLEKLAAETRALRSP